MASEGRKSLVAVLALILLVTPVAGLAAADPPTEPDHGVNETMFPLLGTLAGTEVMERT